MIKTILGMCVGTALAFGQAQPKQSLLVTQVSNITLGYIYECGGVQDCLDNRSVYLRNNNYSSVYATGTGSWQVQIQTANGSPSGFASCGSAATITNSSSPPIAYCLGYADYFLISITGTDAGTVSVTYTGQNQLYLSSGTGSVSFPITVANGGTGSSTALGAKVNLNTFPNTVSSDYNFTPQTPGGTLIAHGSNQAITLNPCPIGVSGSDTNHYLYLTAGTGTSEIVPITGGTCVSGASSGTITVTPAYGHSGLWTVQSATGGIQEACNIQPWVGVPSGVVPIYGPITPPANSRISGTSKWSTDLMGQFTLSAAPLFNTINSGIQVDNLFLGQVSVGTTDSVDNFTAGTRTFTPVSITNIVAGESVAIDSNTNREVVVVLSTTASTFTCTTTKTHNGTVTPFPISAPVNGNYGVYANGSGGSSAAAYLTLVDLIVSGFYENIYLFDLAQTGNIERVQVNNGLSDGITFSTSYAHVTGLDSIDNAGNGIVCFGNVCPEIKGFQTFGNQLWGYTSNGPNQIMSGFMNNDGQGEIHLTTSLAEGGTVTDILIQAAGAPPFFAPVLTAPGVLVDSTVQTVALKGLRLFNNNGIGIDNRGIETEIIGSSVIGSGQGAQSGNLYAIKSSGPEASFSSNNFQGIALISGAGHSIFGNTFNAAVTGTPTLEVGSGATSSYVCGNVIQNGGISSPALQVDSGASVFPCANTIPVGSYVNNGSFPTLLVPTYQTQTLTVDTAGTIASAGTITPPTQIVHVTGTASTNLMTVPFVPTGQNATPTVTLIADGAWVIAAGGAHSGNNYAFAVGFTATQAQAYTFYFDGTLWYGK